VALWRLRWSIRELDERVEAVVAETAAAAEALGADGGTDGEVSAFVQTVCEDRRREESALLRRRDRLVVAERECVQRALRERVDPADRARLDERMHR
jgi:hypothetical protein